ncbi:MAG: GNAT family N-acetyltransferase/peptidase C39 family protein [Gammaproteobacteria bacterium]|nr:GNAT family N-acetyltransferase/peptidase C39 family protein [Gammaproteobacteria bacterium]
MIRTATLADLDRLVAIEEQAFTTDRFSRRTFRYLITKANASLQVYELEGEVHGYVILLFNTGISLSRIYSIAVDSARIGQGIGLQLMQAAEQITLQHNCIALRLEVRADNAKAITLYKKLGYKQFAISHDYYEDHVAALRFEKSLTPHFKPDIARVPYYQQTLDFTCGPAALMMAMHALDPSLEQTRELELRLWRESTTIFMTSGHGGCGPYGMALAAARRGFEVELYISVAGTLFIDSVRSEEKKEVMRLVQDDMLNELTHYPVKIQYTPLSVDALQSKFDEGGILIVLISLYRIYKAKIPHWVVVTGFDENYVYAHDPYTEPDGERSAVDCVNMPIPKKDFARMSRYGRSGQKAVLIIKPSKTRN